MTDLGGAIDRMEKLKESIDIVKNIINNYDRDICVYVQHSFC